MDYVLLILVSVAVVLHLITAACLVLLAACLWQLHELVRAGRSRVADDAGAAYFVKDVGPNNSDIPAKDYFYKDVDPEEEFMAEQRERALAAVPPAHLQNVTAWFDKEY